MIYCLTVRLELLNPAPILDLSPFELKTGTPVTPAPGNVHANFGFSLPYCFRVRSLYWTDGQTDGRARPVLWPIRTAAQPITVLPQ